ncbi:hypothetical protein QR680_007021 [Steinernema hermaphroditum]|uniref:Apple domain-containing protein n=1 Tax=Steinernema hermaphroditum TaxID=289476 RepID=A0AA39LYC7_9BILA|nr:hypothetical protein QR680_007021 [Steinernema hermaphroditum]
MWTLRAAAAAFIFFCVLCGNADSERKEYHFRVSNDSELNVHPTYGLKSVKSAEDVASATDCMARCALHDECAGGLYAAKGRECFVLSKLSISDTKYYVDNGGQSSFVKVPSLDEQMKQACGVSFTDIVKDAGMAPSRLKP